MPAICSSDYQAPQTDPAIAARVTDFRKRTLEELYNLKKDPDCLHNLINDKKHAQIKEQMFQKMKAYMQSSNDSLLSAFENRYDKDALRQGLEFAKKSASNIKGMKPHMVKRKNK